MKLLKPQHLALSLSLLGCSFSAHAQLMLSQYIDGSSNKKGLEIYNPDATTVNLADYEIQQFSNGAVSKTFAVILQGTLKSKEKFIVGRQELKDELGAKVQQVAGLSFNGDDALVLLYKGQVIDRFGRVGEQPSNGWGSAGSKGQSFSRLDTQNNVSSIDPKAVFNLDQSWKVWSDRDAFAQYLAGASVTPPSGNISCSSADTPIADLHTAAQNQSYVVRGIITADYRYQDGFSGFYIQTPDSKAKANVSNAIFVYLPNASTIQGGKVGEEVIFKGRLTNYQNQLQLDQLSSQIQTCNSSVAHQVTAQSVQLPFNSLNDVAGHSAKRYQGMLVKLPQTLTISENYNYGRFGELSLSLGRLYIPTNLFAANSTEAKNLAQQNVLSKIILDDGYNNQNRTPWLPEVFNAKNTVRAGNQIQNVEGILEYRFNAWRIQPIPNQTKPQVISTENARPSIQAKNAQQIRVSAFNVLNYDNSPLIGVKPDRGANTVSEFNRQHEKIVSAMKSIDADVYGLMEIANNGYSDKSAVAYLTKALGVDWKYVTPPNAAKLGTDAIAVAIIYNSKRVKPVGAAVVYDDSSMMNRVTMAQTFQPIAGGKNFTIVPNHLKSKRCDGAKGLDLDQKDGQGCYNQTRLTAVEKLSQWIAKNPTQVSQPHYLLVGDFNSYAKEAPILALENAKYKVLLNDEKIGQGKTAYSYVFGVASDANGYGGAGNLDHAIADQDLYPLVKRAFAWHINADEPTALDYNEEYKTDAQKADFYAADAFRSSDHDPIIVDLDLNTQVTPPKPEPENEHKKGGGALGLWSILLLVFMAFAATVYRRKRL